MNFRQLLVVLPAWFDGNEAIKILDPLLVRLSAIQLSPQPIQSVGRNSAYRKWRRMFSDSLCELSAALIPGGFIKRVDVSSRI
jgi:hypothetical protein